MELFFKYKTKHDSITSSTRQQQQWFSVCIFPIRQLFGLTGNRSNPPLREAIYVKLSKNPLLFHIKICIISKKNRQLLDLDFNQPSPSCLKKTYF
jgi:hypothetical protein